MHEYNKTISDAAEQAVYDAAQALCKPSKRQSYPMRLLASIHIFNNFHYSASKRHDCLRLLAWEECYPEKLNPDEIAFVRHAFLQAPQWLQSI